MYNFIQNWNKNDLHKSILLDTLKEYCIICPHNCRDVLFIFIVIWAEQGTLWCNNIPLLATNDMPQPGCVCYASVCCHSLCMLILSKTELRSVCMDVYCTSEQGVSGGLMQWEKACVPFECWHANLCKLLDFSVCCQLYTLQTVR